MEDYLVTLLITGTFIASVIGVGMLTIDWLVHKDMTKSHSNVHGKGTFNQFKKHFNNPKIHWENSGSWKTSAFDHSTNSEYHANIIRFFGFGMVMKNPIELIKVRLYMRKYFKARAEAEKPSTHIW